MSYTIAQKILNSEIKPVSSELNANYETSYHCWYEHSWLWGKKGERTGFYVVVTPGTREDTTSLGGDSIRDGQIRHTSRITSNGKRYRYRVSDLVAAGLLEE